MKKKLLGLDIINNICLFFENENLIQPNTKILLTISGGQDSISLLIFFYIFQKQWNIDLKILYCNHLWESNSLNNHGHISKIAYSLNLNLIFFLSFFSIKTEEKSRFWRSEIFLRIGAYKKVSLIATGHTLTDKSETFFFNLLRGAGSKGSSSLQLKKKELINNFLNKPKNSNIKYFLFLKSQIKFSHNKKRNPNTLRLSPIYNKKLIKNSNLLVFEQKSLKLKSVIQLKSQIIRPLLKITRIDVRNLCTTLKLPLYPDETNQKLIYSRNRLRKQVFPTFRFFFNPKVDFSFSRYNDLMFAEEIFLNFIVEKITKLIIFENTEIIYFNINSFVKLSLALQRRFLIFLVKNKLNLNISSSLIDNFSVQLKKNKVKLYSIDRIKYIFFPKIGIIGISNNLLLFFKQ